MECAHSVYDELFVTFCTPELLFLRVNSSRASLMLRARISHRKSPSLILMCVPRGERLAYIIFSMNFPRGDFTPLIKSTNYLEPVILYEAFE